MDDLFAELASLTTELGSAGRETRLIGGLAVRLLVGVDARHTHDIDVVAMTEAARATLLSVLARRGYSTGTTGHFWRAVPGDGSRRFIDIFSHPVVDVRTFDAVSLRSAAREIQVGAATVSVAAPSDLVLLKLMAGRDQDLVDLLLLAATCAPDVAAVAQTASLDDVERRVAGGAVRARNELQAGALQVLAEQVLGKPPSASALQALDEMLRALEKEGL